MKLRCPNCQEAISYQPSAVSLNCPSGHEFGWQNGVLQLLESGFSTKLHAFLEKFEPFRAKEGQRLEDKTIYEQLPFTPNLQADHEWRLRTYDALLLDKLLAHRPNQTVLDLGAWNGWLSHYLTQQGHQVVAVDYFTDPYDGLGANQFFSTEWMAVQLDLRHLSPLNQQFDVVIVNRCLQFFDDPAGYIPIAQEKVAPGGLLLITGLAFFRHWQAKAESVAAFRRYLNEHDIDYFKPMKGYLDFDDIKAIKAQGIALRPYPQLRLANLKSRLLPSAPRYYYGIYSD